MNSVSTFKKNLGGYSANLAVAASRLGLSSGVLSAVAQDPMGGFVENSLRKEGVETKGLMRKKDSLTALTMMGIDSSKKCSAICSDQNVADLLLEAKEVDEDLVESSKILVITGGYCSTEKTYAATCRAVNLALRSGRKVVLDINYLPTLWKAKEKAMNPAVADRLLRLLPRCSLILGTEEEICLAVNQPYIERAVSVLEQISGAVVVRKRGSQGCVCYCPRSGVHISESFPAKAVNIQGESEAFLAGFLKGYINNFSLVDSARIANLCASLIISRKGCVSQMPYWKEVEHSLYSLMNQLV